LVILNICCRRAPRLWLAGAEKHYSTNHSQAVSGRFSTPYASRCATTWHTAFAHIGVRTGPDVVSPATCPSPADYHAFTCRAAPPGSFCAACTCFRHLPAATYALATFPAFRRYLSGIRLPLSTRATVLLRWRSCVPASWFRSLWDGTLSRLLTCLLHICRCCTSFTFLPSPHHTGCWILRAFCGPYRRCRRCLNTAITRRTGTRRHRAPALRHLPATRTTHRTTPHRTHACAHLHGLPFAYRWRAAERHARRPHRFLYAYCAPPSTHSSTRYPHYLCPCSHITSCWVDILLPPRSVWTFVAAHITLPFATRAVAPRLPCRATTPVHAFSHPAHGLPRAGMYAALNPP